jgi:hypothetical protein
MANDYGRFVTHWKNRPQIGDPQVATDPPWRGPVNKGSQQPPAQPITPNTRPAQTLAPVRRG